MQNLERSRIKKLSMSKSFFFFYRHWKNMVRHAGFKLLDAFEPLVGITEGSVILRKLN